MYISSSRPGAVDGASSTYERIESDVRDHSLLRPCPSLPSGLLPTSLGGAAAGCHLRLAAACGSTARRRNFQHSAMRTYCSATTVASRPANIREVRQLAQSTESPAAVLAIGTANPRNCVWQDEYADYYFRITHSEHLTKLKAKMKRMCAKSGIKKRHFHHTEKMIHDNPEFLDRTQPSVDARQSILETAVPELAAAAAEDAIAEWGRPASEITHLVMSTYSSAHMPSADLRLANLLGLRPSVHRTILYLQGCTAASAALRVAKDIAENNRGARVLVACAELTISMFRAPEEAYLDTIVMQSLFDDGAGAMIIGAEPMKPIERPLFEMLSASQAVIPEISDRPASGTLGEAGFVFHPSTLMPALVGTNIEKCVADALQPHGLGVGGGGLNDLFWAVQPSGRAILDAVEGGLALHPGKLDANRRILGEYGYMSGVSMIYVLDELRRRSRCLGDHERQGELGVMLGIGPGISVETMLLRRSEQLRI